MKQVQVKYLKQRKLAWSDTAHIFITFFSLIFLAKENRKIKFYSAVNFLFFYNQETFICDTSAECFPKLKIW